MKQKLTREDFTDDDGKPAGGTATAVGLDIRWQDGPLGRGDERKVPNGSFVETVIHAALQRIEFYQSGEFACVENAEVIDHLGRALFSLECRTDRREKEGVEGTHTP